MEDSQALQWIKWHMNNLVSEIVIYCYFSPLKYKKCSLLLTLIQSYMCQWDLNDNINMFNDFFLYFVQSKE